MIKICKENCSPSTTPTPQFLSASLSIYSAGHKGTGGIGNGAVPIVGKVADHPATPTAQLPSASWSIYSAVHKGTGDIMRRGSTLYVRLWIPRYPHAPIPLCILEYLQCGSKGNRGQNGAGEFPFPSLSPFSVFRLTAS